MNVLINRYVFYLISDNIFWKNTKESGKDFAPEKVNWGSGVIKHGRETYITLQVLMQDLHFTSCTNPILNPSLLLILNASKNKSQLPPSNTPCPFTSLKNSVALNRVLRTMCKNSTPPRLGLHRANIALLPTLSFTGPPPPQPLPLWVFSK